MFKPFEFCIPTKSTSVPAGPEWLHEIKYDGFRMLVQRDGDRVRLITRNGHDWTKRYPWIVQDALKNRHKQFVIDGEAVILGVDGYSDFNALHAGRHNEEVQLGAFDVLAMDGDDLRDLRLSLRKANLQRLLARRPDERPLNPTNRRTRQGSSMWGNLPLTRKAPYKVKNRKHPAMDRSDMFGDDLARVTRLLAWRGFHALKQLLSVTLLPPNQRFACYPANSEGRHAR